MKTTGGIDKYNISIIRLGTLNSIEGNTSRVRAHLLLDNRHSDTVAPNLNLLYSGGTESIGSTKIDLLSSFLELISKLTDSCGLANSIHSDYQYDVWLVIGRQVPIAVIARVILRKQICNSTTKDTVEL